MSSRQPPPLVTIGIPTYKRPDLLPRALESVAKQTYQPLEVYVVDDGTPGTENEKIVDAFKKKIPGLTFYKNPKNLGFAKTYFNLVERATGEFFMWLADDDEMSPTYIEAAVETLQMYSEAVSATLSQNLMFRGLSIFPPSYMEDSWFRRLFSFVILDCFRDFWVSRPSFYFSVNRTTSYQQASRKAAERYFRCPLKPECIADIFLRSELLLLGKVVPVIRKDAAYYLYDGTEKEYYCEEKPIARNGSFQKHASKIRVYVDLVRLLFMHVRQAYDWGGIKRALPFGIGLLATPIGMLFSSMRQQVFGRANGLSEGMQKAKKT